VRGLIRESPAAQTARAQITLEARKSGTEKVLEAFRRGEQLTNRDIAKQLSRGRLISEVVPTGQPLREVERFIGQAGAGLVGDFAGGLDWLFKTGLTKEINQNIQAWSLEKAPEVPQLSDEFARALGSGVGFLLPGLGIAKSKAVLGRVAPKLANALGLSLSATLEALAEAGGTYNSVLKKTKNKEMANAAGNRVFYSNLPLNVLTNKFGLYADKLGGSLARFSASSGVEGLQEVGQELITDVVEGKDISLRDLGKTFLIGTGTAGVLGKAITSPSLLGPRTYIDSLPDTRATIQEDGKVLVKPPLTETRRVATTDPETGKIVFIEIPFMPPIQALKSDPNVAFTESPTDEAISSEEINKDYEVIKGQWHSNLDWQENVAEVTANKQKQRIKESVGETIGIKKSLLTDEAMHLYQDLKGRPEKIVEKWHLLTPEQQSVVERSQNLTPEQQAIADEIIEQEEALGVEALEAGAIRNFVQNHTNRTWNFKNDQAVGQLLSKFGTTTRHARPRVFDSILDGWTTNRKTGEQKQSPGEPGYELKVKGATENLRLLKNEMRSTIENKALVNNLIQTRDINGNALLSVAQLPGYRQIQHPGFTVWEPSATATTADIRGANFFRANDGTIVERKNLYAPAYIADTMNNILGVSALSGRARPPVKGGKLVRGAVAGGRSTVDAVTKYNAIVKSMILQTSFFHHLAFLNSYYLGGQPFGDAFQRYKSGERFVDALKSLNPLQAMREGLEAISALGPESEMLIREGLTLGRRQDWEEDLIAKEDSMVGRWLDKHKATREAKDAILRLKQVHNDFLWKKLGPGLKMKAGLIELRAALKKHPDKDPNEVAREVANLMNNDFGGLHLKRIGRSPTYQHMFRLAALAPDWTESNVRSMIGAFKGGLEGELHRAFWTRIIAKGMLINLILNVLLHGEDTPEVYMRNWKDGKLRIFDTDITPIAKMFGYDDNTIRHFGVMGHFTDPFKWGKDPARGIFAKKSPVMRHLWEFFSGADWMGRDFTEFNELLKTKSTVRPKFTFVGRPGFWQRTPSFLVNQAMGDLPIQAQNMIKWHAGEMDAFDAIANSAGLRIKAPGIPVEGKLAQKKVRKQILKLKGKPRRRRRRKKKLPFGQSHQQLFGPPNGGKS
jgi:hypothetical protein